jgi:hypothetical protein
MPTGAVALVPHLFFGEVVLKVASPLVHVHSPGDTIRKQVTACTAIRCRYRLEFSNYRVASAREVRGNAHSAATPCRRGGPCLCAAHANLLSVLALDPFVGRGQILFEITGKIGAPLVLDKTPGSAVRSLVAQRAAVREVG